jgi:hypothetical protein
MRFGERNIYLLPLALSYAWEIHRRLGKTLHVDE